MTRLRGLAGVIGILLIVCGVPWLLLSIGASPVPESFSISGIWDAIRKPADSEVFRSVFTYAAWLAWLFLTVCLVVEVVARLVGADSPDLPGLSLPQGMARGLVGMAALLFVAVPTVTSGTGSATAAPGGPDTTQAAGHVAVASAAADRAEASLAASSASAHGSELADSASDQAAESGPEIATRTHTVERGETLWSIAETHLGDGARYTEILDLNPGVSAHWITPGTDLAVPDEAPTQSATHTVEVRAGDTLWDIAEDELGDGSRYDEIAQASAETPQPDGEHLSDPDLIKPGWQLTVPGSTTHAEQTSTTHASTPAADETTRDTTSESTPAGTDDADTAAEAGSESVTTAPAGTTTDVAPSTAAAESDADAETDVALTADSDDGWAATALGLGSLTAAGVIRLLAAARRRAARRGQTLPQSADEAELLLAADEHSLDTVDLALRDLVRVAEEDGAPVPALRTVRLTPERIDVQLEDRVQMPAPWTATADPRLWTLSVDRIRSLDVARLDPILPPYPALVSLGTDAEDAHVLVNLALAQTFTVVGEQRTTRAVVAALALDLTSSPWADRTTVTVIGGDPRLVQAIGSDRLRHVADPAAYFVAESVTTETTSREVVLVSGALSEREQTRLTRAVSSSPRIALVHTDDSAGAAWSLTVGADPDAAVLAPSHLQLRAQRLDEGDTARIAELFELAVTSEGYWAPREEPTLATIGEAAAALGSPGVVLDASGVVVASSDDDAPTRSRADIETAPRRTPRRWNTPIAGTTASQHGDAAAQVETVPRTTGSAWTASASTPRWLSVQITPTPGVPVPPVVDYPLRDVTLPDDGPILRLLGPVDIDHAPTVRESHRARLTELAAYLALHPESTDEQLDDAMWPNRSTHDHGRVRLSALSALGEWLSPRAAAAYDATGAPELGRRAATQLTTDWALWQQLLPDGVTGASTERLEQALGLVRGRPFVGARARHYVWATALRHRMVETICGTAAELARRRLLEGRWAAAYDATRVGLIVEPSAEPLWRLQVLAASEMDEDLAQESAAGLRELGGQDDADLDSASRRLLQEIDLHDTVQPVRGVG